MLLIMIVFAIMSAGLFYASRVPTFRQEIEVFLTGKKSSSDTAGHSAHIVFIMFTFTSPLLLAGVLSTYVGISRWFNERRQRKQGSQ